MLSSLKLRYGLSLLAVLTVAFPLGARAQTLTDATCKNAQECYGRCKGKKFSPAECEWHFKGNKGTLCQGTIHGTLCAPSQSISLTVRQNAGVQNVLYNGDPLDIVRYRNACRFIDNNTEHDILVPQDTADAFAAFINKAAEDAKTVVPPAKPSIGLGFCALAGSYSYSLKPDSYGFLLFGEGGPRSKGLPSSWAASQHGTWDLPTTRVLDAEGKPNLSQPQTARITYIRRDCIPNTTTCNTRNVIEVRTLAVPILPSSCDDPSIVKNKNCDGIWDNNPDHFVVLKRDYYVERIDSRDQINALDLLENLDPKVVTGPYADDTHDYQPPSVSTP